MSDTAIEVRGIGKRFDIGADQGSAKLLTENLSERVRAFGRRQKFEEYWALRDVSFEVRRGETMGIIGHNGAGKSTLLKILSRITPPTTGEARLRGRVGALLEVGTGFHPELTGRENIFLNGAILSMTRAEIARKFDEIVEFADIGPFVDTPVKRYSSGMQLRLGFSVAAHLEPEILIVDEVLAVGDIAFQEKCLGRMESATREGRTVVFISHNLTAVRGLCDRAIMLSAGRVAAAGGVSEVIDAYVGDVLSSPKLSLAERQDRTGDGRLRFTGIWLERNGEVVDTAVSGEDLDIVASFETADGRQLRHINFGVVVTGQGDDNALLHLHSGDTGELFREVPSSGAIRCRLPRCPLPSGQYSITIGADTSSSEPLDFVRRAADMTVAGGDFFGSGRDPTANRTVLVEHTWSVDSADGGTHLAPAASSSGGPV